MRTCIAFLAVLLSFPFLTQAPILPPRDFVYQPEDQLLAHICARETEGQSQPVWAVNRHGSAWGVCQIKYWSAVYFGGFDEQMRLTEIPSRNPADLFDEGTNRRVASKILNYCRARYPAHSTRRLVYCWLAGPNSPAYSTREGYWFSKRVASDYAQAHFKLEFETQNNWIFDR